MFTAVSFSGELTGTFCERQIYIRSREIWFIGNMATFRAYESGISRGTFGLVVQGLHEIVAPSAENIFDEPSMGLTESHGCLRVFSRIRDQRDETGVLRYPSRNDRGGNNRNKSRPEVFSYQTIVLSIIILESSAKSSDHSRTNRPPSRRRRTSCREYARARFESQKFKSIST